MGWLTNLFAPRKNSPQPAMSARPQLRAAYDLERSTHAHWDWADNLSADSANSPNVRQRMIARTRYEAANNPFLLGALSSHSLTLVGRGPAFRALTDDKGFNREVNSAWWRWAQAIRLRRKLTCQVHAKGMDGEGFGVARTNDLLSDPVKVDYAIFEAERCSSPRLPYVTEGRVDGIHFDPQTDHIIGYDILPYHPGGPYSYQEAEFVPAQFICHLFDLKRPGAHRGVSPFVSSLKTGADSRRWREATLRAAEFAASHSGVIKTQTNVPLQQVDDVAAWDQAKFASDLSTFLPKGWELDQMRAEHPNAQWKEFFESNVGELVRPIGMPRNIGLGSSASANFSSANLDWRWYCHLLACERLDIDDLVLEPLTKLWYQEAALVYGWDPNLPDHEFHWPAMPDMDPLTTAKANEIKLKTATTTLSRIFSEQGLDEDDEIESMARTYNITPDEMRGLLVKAVLQQGPEQGAKDEQPEPTPA